MMRIITLVLAVALSGCATGARQAPASDVANATDPASFRSVATDSADVYRIGPADKLALRVLQVPDLSFDEIVVDAGGNIQLPLVGSVKAAGMTASELAEDIRAKLSVSYMRDPQVAVTISDSASQKITVDGAVTKPGVYEMQGRTTLLQAVSMAEGPTRIANLRSVAVFRDNDGQPTVAVFDMDAIRGGQAVDPVLRGDDVVIVDTSRLNARLQDPLLALPALSSFFFYSTQ